MADFETFIGQLYVRPKPKWWRSKRFHRLSLGKTSHARKASSVAGKMTFQQLSKENFASEKGVLCCQRGSISVTLKGNLLGFVILLQNIPNRNLLG